MLFLYIIRVGELFVVRLLFSIHVDLHVRPHKLRCKYSITYNSDVRANNVPRFSTATHVACVQLLLSQLRSGVIVLLRWYTYPSIRSVHIPRGLSCLHIHRDTCIVHRQFSSTERLYFRFDDIRTQPNVSGRPFKKDTRCRYVPYSSK